MWGRGRAPQGSAAGRVDGVDTVDGVDAAAKPQTGGHRGPPLQWRVNRCLVLRASVCAIQATGGACASPTDRGAVERGWLIQ